MNNPFPIPQSPAPVPTPRLSAKARVALWIACSMFTLSIATFAAVVSVGRSVARATARTLLDTNVRDCIHEIELGYLDVDDKQMPFPEDIFLSIRERAADGAQSIPLYGRFPEGFDRGTPFLPSEHPRVTSDGIWFVLDMTHEMPGRGVLEIRGVTPASEIDAAFKHIAWLSLIGLPILVLASAAGGWLLTARAFQPIGKITATARQISGGDDLAARIGMASGKDEICGLAAMLDEMLARLQQSFEQERQFSSDVSHELRTPLAVVIAQCENALDSDPASPAAPMFQTILAQASRMSAIISQLLALAKSDAADELTTRENVNLAELAEIIADEIASKAAAKNIRVIQEIDGPLHTCGDVTMLMRLLLNLTENGIKFGRDGGFVKLRLFMNGAKIVCEISDDGIGIAPEHIRKIWRRLYQADRARDTEGGGMGLGLPMARHIVRAHGGEISVESEAGRGSVFTFTLPAISGSH